MGIHSRIGEAVERIPSPELLIQYELLEECVLSGQVSHVEVQGIIRDDPAFGRWLERRATNRTR
jgi:hypothetical protein